MWLGDGSCEIGPLTPETVIQAFELCGHRCVHGENGLVLVYARDGLRWYPIYPDPGDAESFPPEALAYCMRKVHASWVDFVARVIALTNPAADERPEQ